MYSFFFPPRTTIAAPWGVWVQNIQLSTKQITLSIFFSLQEPPLRHPEVYQHKLYNWVQKKSPCKYFFPSRSHHCGTLRCMSGRLQAQFLKSALDTVSMSSMYKWTVTGRISEFLRISVLSIQCLCHPCMSGQFRAEILKSIPSSTLLNPKP